MDSAKLLGVGDDVDRHDPPPGHGERGEDRTTWPESRRNAAPRGRRAPRPEPAPPTFGDRPAVVIAVWISLSLLFFVGTWLGSLAP